MATTRSIDRPEGWVVLDGLGIPIPEATAFLRHLAAVERSPNTIKAYASDLALFFTFAASRDLLWTAVNNEALGQFIAWLRIPRPEKASPHNPDGMRSVRTVNRALSAVSSFAHYLHDATADPVYLTLLRTARTRSNRFVEDAPTTVTVGPRLPTIQRELKCLDDASIQRIIDSCATLRDKFLISLLDQTGMRIGQALQLRHSDIRVPTSAVQVERKPDQSAQGKARNKSFETAVVPVPGWLIRLYAGYMSAEYGFIDSDFVFVNLWSGCIGQPMSYSNVDRLISRLQRTSGVTNWSAHTFRHTYVTRLLKLGVSPETVAYLVTHRSVLTTLNTYNHIDTEDIRDQLVRSGAWES